MSPCLYNQRARSACDSAGMACRDPCPKGEQPNWPCTSGQGLRPKSGGIVQDDRFSLSPHAPVAVHSRYRRRRQAKLHRPCRGWVSANEGLACESARTARLLRCHFTSPPRPPPHPRDSARQRSDHPPESSLAANGPLSLVGSFEQRLSSSALLSQPARGLPHFDSPRLLCMCVCVHVSRYRPAAIISTPHARMLSVDTRRQDLAILACATSQCLSTLLPSTSVLLHAYHSAQ